MQFDPALKPATLIKRYKRFLADVRTPEGEEFTIHCPNTGAMTGCAEPGMQIWYSTSDNPKRKYPCTWELSVTKDGDWICVNTGRANSLIEEAIKGDLIPGLAPYSSLRREVKYDENSRADIVLEHSNENGNQQTFIEVKSVTLLQDGQGYFPDAVSTRGHKHLQALERAVADGHRAILVYAILHTGILEVSPAAHIDKRYAELFAQAKAAGVEVKQARFAINQESMQCKIAW